jgi:hypothetical protein
MESESNFNEPCVATPPVFSTLNLSAINYEGAISIDIIDMNGKTVLSKDQVKGTSKIDISQLSGGTYFVLITMNDKVTQVKKIIVTR